MAFDSRTYAQRKNLGCFISKRAFPDAFRSTGLAFKKIYETPFMLAVAVPKTARTRGI